jgi:hypothetical protein
MTSIAEMKAQYLKTEEELKTLPKLVAELKLHPDDIDLTARCKTLCEARDSPYRAMLPALFDCVGGDVVVAEPVSTCSEN